jgi:UDP-N-acetylmuramoylalanine--D-glutamate ligase
MEFVRTVNGVEWVNDSKATNVDAVWYALGSFSTPVILIAGGRDKDADFRLLRQRVKERARSVVLLGEAADKLEQAFRGVCPLIRVDSLEEAVEKARGIAQLHDVVLLSPGCASFDMFKNFEDRGDRFKALVERL